MTREILPSARLPVILVDFKLTQLGPGGEHRKRHAREFLAFSKLGPQLVEYFGMTPLGPRPGHGIVQGVDGKLQVCVKF